MVWLTDRKAVELLLPLAAIEHVLEAGVEEKTPVYHETLGNIGIAYAEVLDRHTGGSSRVKLFQRTNRLVDLIVKPFVRKHEKVSTVGLIVFFIIKHLVDYDYLVYAPNGAVDKALNAFVQAIVHEAHDEQLLEYAYEEATRYLGMLRKDGYYI